MRLYEKLKTYMEAIQRQMVEVKEFNRPTALKEIERLALLLR